MYISHALYRFRDQPEISGVEVLHSDNNSSG